CDAGGAATAPARPLSICDMKKPIIIGPTNECPALVRWGTHCSAGYSCAHSSRLAYCGAASAACCCAAANAWRQLEGSPVAALQASTEVYSPSCTCTVCSCWQAVNSSGAVLISSSAVVLERFIIVIP